MRWGSHFAPPDRAQAAAWAALAAAWPRVPEARRVGLVALMAVSARAATGMGLVGCEWWRIALIGGTSAAIAWAATRLGGRDLGIGMALLAAEYGFHAWWETLGPMIADLVRGRFPATMAIPPRVAKNPRQPEYDRECPPGALRPGPGDSRC